MSGMSAASSSGFRTAQGLPMKASAKLLRYWRSRRSAGWVGAALSALQYTSCPSRLRNQFTNTLAALGLGEVARMLISEKATGSGSGVYQATGAPACLAFSAWYGAAGRYR